MAVYIDELHEAGQARDEMGEELGRELEEERGGRGRMNLGSEERRRDGRKGERKGERRVRTWNTGW